MARSRCGSSWLLAVLLVLGAPEAWSEEEEAAEPTQPSASSTTAQPQGSELALSLQEAIAMGLENNLDVEIVRHDPLIAEEEYQAARGVHDPNLYGQFDYASREIPIASALQSGSRLVERETNGGVGLQGLVPKLGWSYDVGFTGRRLQTTSSIQDLSPEYTSRLTGNVTMPILKGFLWGQAWTQVKLTGVNNEIARELYRQQIMDIVVQIEAAYWQLAADRENREVANKSLETARALLAQTKAQYEVGVVSKVEVTESEAGLADRELNQIQRDNAYRNAQDDLVDLVLGPYLAPTTDLNVRNTDKPEDYVTFQLDPEASTKKAFEKRPELEIARFQVEQSQINIKFARNQWLPQLDLVANYGYQGLAGKTNPQAPLFGGITEPGVEPIPVTDFTGTPIGVGSRQIQVPVLNDQGEQIRQPAQIGRSFWSSDDDFFSADGAKQWNAGALLSIPLGNRTGRAGVTKAELELRKTRTALRRLEQQIIHDVRRTVRALRDAQQGILAAERRRIAAAAQERAEQIRLEHGESTPFDVLLREEDLVEAESQKISALQLYHSSVAALDRAQGTILDDRGVVVEETMPLR